jgi:hypothetical protein
MRLFRWLGLHPRLGAFLILVLIFLIWYNIIIGSVFLMVLIIIIRKKLRKMKLQREKEGKGLEWNWKKWQWKG